MKRVFASLFAVFLCSLAWAQTSPKFSYQAVVRNALNELVVNDTVWVGISFYNHELSGTAAYSERHIVVSNANGLISLMIGEGTEPTGNLSHVTWNDAYVRTEVTLREGIPLSDVKPVSAVPFACYAEQIPLRAIEEHLGSTNLVSVDALADTLARYVTEAGLSDTLTHYVTEAGLSDTLARYVTEAGLSDTLTHYVTEAGLSDTLARYVTEAGLSDTLARYVTEVGLSDTLARYMTEAGLSDTLANYVPRSSFETAIQALRDEMDAVTSVVDNFTVTSSQVSSNTFVLGHLPLANRMVLMFINGILISQSAYSVTDNQLRYLSANNGGKVLETGDRVQIYYYYK